MALVSGGRSTLNPNAPLFVPAAFRQVEDFSPEWWELVKTSKWFHDYWLNQHQELEMAAESDDEDIANLLPESFDLGITDEFLSLEMSMEDSPESALFAVKKEGTPSGLEVNPEAMIKNLSLKSPSEAAKHCERPTQYSHTKCGPTRIQQTQ